MSASYLLDAGVTGTNAVRLRLLDEILIPTGRELTKGEPTHVVTGAFGT